MDRLQNLGTSDRRPPTADAEELVVRPRRPVDYSNVKERRRGERPMGNEPRAQNTVRSWASVVWCSEMDRPGGLSYLQYTGREKALRRFELCFHGGTACDWVFRRIARTLLSAPWPGHDGDKMTATAGVGAHESALISWYSPAATIPANCTVARSDERERSTQGPRVRPVGHGGLASPVKLVAGAPAG
jgi:hypothetical protein